MCDYFTIRQQRMFPSYTIDVKEQAIIDRFLQLLNRSGVAQILDSVKDKNTNMGGRPYYNINNLFSMQEEIPTYRTICNFINEYIVPNTDAIFKEVNNAILDECGINLEDAYIDGTKIEADANKYKFVWKPTTFHIRLSDKIRTLLLLNNLDRGIPNKGIVSSTQIAENSPTDNPAAFALPLISSSSSWVT